MPKLKLAPLQDDKPVRLTLELPAQTHRDLVAYAKIFAEETQGALHEPSRLVAPMLERFMATDRAFQRARHSRRTAPE